MSAWWANLHFLRPEWLLLALPALIVWWQLLRQRDPRQRFKDQVAGHLLDALVIQPKAQSRLRPATLLLALWLVASVALAGPSWRREISPFAEDQAGLVLVVKMSPSMDTADLLPSRLERCRIKVSDLLQMRVGANTGLIAYSGSAHLVMPLTEDNGVIEHMLEALTPEVMPREGDDLAAALALAAEQIARSERPGSVLLLTDAVESQQIRPLASWRESNRTGVQILAMLENDEALVASGIKEAAAALKAPFARVTPDRQDVTAISRRAESAVVGAAADSGSRWRDEGYLLVPILMVGVSLWGRRGWSVPLR